MIDKLVKVKLYGHLRKFGKEFELYVKTPAEAIRALCSMVPGFKAFLTHADKQGIHFAVFNGKTNIGEEEFALGAKDEIRIATVYAGRKNGGFTQILLGVALIAVAVLTGGAGVGLVSVFSATGLTGGLAWMGASLILGGMLQMMTPQASLSAESSDTENKSSYAFGGPVNTTAQGSPVGILYGEREIGGAVISAGIYTEDIA